LSRQKQYAIGLVYQNASWGFCLHIERTNITMTSYDDIPFTIISSTIPKKTLLPTQQLMFQCSYASKLEGIIAI
jgi:hypothetical protein